jgi:hypothetical protein
MRENIKEFTLFNDYTIKYSLVAGREMQGT